MFAHLLGVVLWMGGGFAGMSLGIAMRSAARNELALLVGLQGRLHRGLILPGCLLTVLSGLLLTLRLYGGAVSAAGFPVPLMVMQGAGLLAAGVVLGVTLPALARLQRLDPSGEQAPLFAALRKRSALAGSLSGGLALAALVAGALLN
ncbi:MAG TPA: hypothetical protein VGQ69_00095 [Gemmatimonadales bacterium]|nr:hypothetical protein [Gemmatimonadales bacterium]